MKYTLRLLTAALMWCALQCSASAQVQGADGAPPSFHFGDWLSIKPRAKIQLDLSAFRPELDDQRKLLRGRRLRFGADGVLFRDLEYSIRVETRNTPEFRDVFLKYRRYDLFQVQAGRFKIPFGLDQLTDSGELYFVHRSRLGSIVAPGRDTGVMVVGETPEGKVNYSLGMFRHDGRNSELEDFAAKDETVPGGDRTVAARATVQPTAFLAVSTPIRNLTVGAAFAYSDLTTGLSSLPGVTVSDQVFFPRLFVSGSRVRRGAELSGTIGSLFFRSEFADTREQRLGQGQRSEDLPDLRTQGWYVSAAHPLFGRRPARQGGFLGSLPPGRERGLVEGAVRYEIIRFGGVSSNGAAPSRSPRATNVLGNDDRAWTFGVNWYASRYVKVQINGVRETLLDPARTPIDGKNNYWTVASRLQLYF